MPLTNEDIRELLLDGLNDEQRAAVASEHRRIVVVAGAGSGKTEVMARRVAWWCSIGEVPRDEVIAFTFTEAAAEELKFRIRAWLGRISDPDAEGTPLGGMYIGTIHGFCLKALRDFAPEDYYMFDVLDEAGRISLLEQGGFSPLGLQAFKREAIDAGAAGGQAAAYSLFMDGYDQLNEHGLLDVELPNEPLPIDVALERDWCTQARLRTEVGDSALATAFADSAARFYAYLKARRFLDFGTVQSELTKRLQEDEVFRHRFQAAWSHLVVDEVQDINPVQNTIIRAIVGDNGHLTAVGDHRQAIYSFRGGRVDLMGDLANEIEHSADGDVIELPANYRSTPRVINIANDWSQSIDDTGGMTNPAMEHGRVTRNDEDDRHVALLRFDDRDAEAAWIAESISSMVRSEAREGVFQDTRNGARGLSFGDIAILVRSGTDIRTYQDALRAAGVPAVVRGGPDLFSQPEVLLTLSAFALASNITQFYGQLPGSLPARISQTLNVPAEPIRVIPAAAAELRDRRINVPEARVERVLGLARYLQRRIATDRGINVGADEVSSPQARQWIGTNGQKRRVFPQQIFHWLLEEAGIAEWGPDAAADTARFHVGQLSNLIKGIETSGWTRPQSLQWQVIALLNWGARRARSEEAPLLVAPDAVSITTIHSSKGLEFGAVFVADVAARRFPSNNARRVPRMPFDLDAVPDIDPARLADNNNYDDERRLMYVALTRAERYLFVTSGGNQRSQFITSLEPIFRQRGAHVGNGGFAMAPRLRFEAFGPNEESNFATSFSDLRYFTECPHDFYMRVVMGFTPTIGQEFGYGRGVHNLLRTVHDNPADWAALAHDRGQLEDRIRALVDEGQFYLRYTTGDPLANLRNKAIRGVADYVQRYREELATLEFEPEKEFETLIDEENLLINGAIDVVRLDDPPRVTIVDFKSGDAREDNGSGLTAELMALQIGVYGLAARHELEYDPQRGLIRYIGEQDAERAEATVNLSDEQLGEVRNRLVTTARGIRSRDFHSGPTQGNEERCGRCDFCNLCRLSSARQM